MSDAPERIWVEVCYIKDGEPQWDAGDWAVSRDDLLPAMGPHIEYIRTDHVDALLKAEREKARREALAAVEGVERSTLADSEGVLPPDHFYEGTSAAYEAILDILSKGKTDG